MRDHLIGDDHRDRDRDQRLSEVLALVPAQEELLDQDSEDGDDRHRDEERDDPFPRVDVGRLNGEALSRHPLLDLVRDVGAEEVEGAVRHVDGAHEAEDEGEAARDDEEEPGERDRVEQGVDESPGVVDRGAGVGRSPPTRTEFVNGFRKDDHVEQHESHEKPDGELGGELPDVELGGLIVHAETNLTTNRDGYNSERAIIDSF